MDKTAPRKIKDILTHRACGGYLKSVKTGFECEKCKLKLTPERLLRSLLQYWEIQWSEDILFNDIYVRFMSGNYSATAFEEFNLVKFINTVRNKHLSKNTIGDKKCQHMQIY